MPSYVVRFRVCAQENFETQSENSESLSEQADRQVVSLEFGLNVKIRLIIHVLLYSHPSCPILSSVVTGRMR